MSMQITALIILLQDRIAVVVMLENPSPFPAHDDSELRSKQLKTAPACHGEWMHARTQQSMMILGWWLMCIEAGSDGSIVTTVMMLCCYLRRACQRRP